MYRTLCFSLHFWKSFEVTFWIYVFDVKIIFFQSEKMLYD